MINKLKINDFTFISDKGSTFIEYFNKDYSIHSHFNIDNNLDFEKACNTFYKNHLSNY